MIGNEPGPSSPLAEILRTLFQSVIAFTGAIYTLGFLVVNSNLTQFGISDYGLVQAKYVAAGLNYAAVHLTIAAMIAVIFAAVGKGPWPLWLVTGLLLWGLLAGFTYAAGRQVNPALITGVNALVMTVLAHQIWIGSRPGSSRWYEQILSSYEIPPQSMLTIVAAGAILLVTLSSITWGRSAWPLMANTLGGGRPASAVLSLDREALPILDYGLIPMQADGLSARLPILLETSDSYIVLIPLDSANTVAVRLPRSAVKAVIYVPSRPGGQAIPLPTYSPPSTQSPSPPGPDGAAPGNPAIAPAH